MANIRLLDFAVNVGKNLEKGMGKYKHMEVHVNKENKKDGVTSPCIVVASSNKVSLLQLTFKPMWQPRPP